MTAENPVKGFVKVIGVGTWLDALDWFPVNLSPLRTNPLHRLRRRTLPGLTKSILIVYRHSGQSEGSGRD
jgi:hypothetical protein